MKIYIAAAYSRREEMESIANRLKRKGFEITSSWVYGGEEGLALEEIAMVDLADVDRADVVLSFTYERGVLSTGGGRHVEFGYGLAKGKRCINICGFENVFHHYPKVETHSSLNAWLETVKVAA